MMKKVLFATVLTTSIFSLELKSPEVFLFDQGKGYKIGETKEKKATCKISFYQEEDFSKYKLSYPLLKGKFLSGTNEIEYALSGFDMKENKISLSKSKETGDIQAPISFVLPGGQNLPPGTYVAEVPVQVKTGDEVVDEHVILASFHVDQQIDVKVVVDGIVEDSEVVKVNFGKITKDSMKQVSLVLKSNTKLEVTLGSKNKGRMKLSTDDDEAEEYYIPYVVESEGKEYDLFYQSKFISTLFEVEKPEVVSNIKFLLKPDFEKTFCGKYNDRVYLTLSSL